mgnify:CR=1 FL=1
MNRKVSYPENLLEKIGIQVRCENATDVFNSIHHIVKYWLTDEELWYIGRRFAGNMTLDEIGKIKGITGARVAQKINKILALFKLPSAVYYLTYGFTFAENSVKERVTVWENESFENFEECPNIKFYHTDMTEEWKALEQMCFVEPSLMVSYNEGAYGTQSMKELLTEISKNLMLCGKISGKQKNESSSARKRSKRIFLELQKLGLMCGSIGNPVLLLPDTWKSKLYKM